MKKLLAIMATTGIVVSSGAAIVSCGTDKDSDGENWPNEIVSEISIENRLIVLDRKTKPKAIGVFYVYNLPHNYKVVSLGSSSGRPPGGELFVSVSQPVFIKTETNGKGQTKTEFNFKLSVSPYGGTGETKVYPFYKGAGPDDKITKISEYPITIDVV